MLQESLVWLCCVTGGFDTDFSKCQGVKTWQQLPVLVLSTALRFRHHMAAASSSGFVNRLTFPASHGSSFQFWFCQPPYVSGITWQQLPVLVLSTALRFRHHMAAASSSGFVNRLTFPASHGSSFQFWFCQPPYVSGITWQQLPVLVLSTALRFRHHMAAASSSGFVNRLTFPASHGSSFQFWFCQPPYVSGITWQQLPVLVLSTALRFRHHMAAASSSGFVNRLTFPASHGSSFQFWFCQPPYVSGITWPTKDSSWILASQDPPTSRWWTKDRKFCYVCWLWCYCKCGIVNRCYWGFLGGFVSLGIWYY